MALAMSRPCKHPTTGIYWFRKAVPQELRAAVGKREEKFTLKKRDPVEAKRLHAEVLMAVEQRWANLRAPIRKLTDSELSIAVYEHCLKLGEVPGIDWDTKTGECLWERESLDFSFSLDKPIILPALGRPFIPPSRRPKSQLRSLVAVLLTAELAAYRPGSRQGCLRPQTRVLSSDPTFAE